MQIKKSRLLIAITVLLIIVLSACNGITPSVEMTINFDTNGGTLVESITYDGEEVVTVPENPTREGYIFAGWYWDNETFERSFTANSLLDEPIQSDLTVYAKWDPLVYDIIYVLNGGVNHEDNPGSFHTGVALSLFDPSKEGYTFGGWYSDPNFATAHTFNNMPTEDITVYAKWNINSYTLQFLDEDNTVLQTADIEYGSDLSGVIPPIASKLGHTFDGWDIELPLTMPAANLTLQATYTINQYTISFETGEGSVIEPITKDYNAEVLAPTNPEKVGHTFGGWYRDTDFTAAYTFNTMPAEDITIYAKWNINTYTITFESNQGSIVDSITMPYQATINRPNNPTRTGYTFDDWYTSMEYTDIFDFSTMPAENITLYAKWNMISYQVNYVDIPDTYQPAESVLLYPNETVIDLFTNDGNNAFLTSSKRLFVWGANQFGKPNYNLPIDMTQEIELNKEETIQSFQVGYHSAVLTSSGRLFAWGENSYGQIGNGTTTKQTTPIDITPFFQLDEGEYLISFTLGRYHSAALSSKGRIFTWGLNSNGQIGNGITVNRLTPLDITGYFDFNEDETIVKIDLGAYHSAAYTSQGRLFLWGNNIRGQLGDGTTIHRHLPMDLTPYLDLLDGENIIEFYTGFMNTAVKLSTGRILIWGDNQDGQLGLGHTTNVSNPTDLTPQFHLFEDEQITSIVLGRYHSSALTSQGRLFTWGRNYDYQLGDETTINRTSPIDITQHVPLQENETIIDHYTGYDHTTLLSSLGRIFTWGNNTYGQLGDGSLDSKISPQPLHIFNFILLNEASYVADELIDLYQPNFIGYAFDGWYSDVYYEHPVTWTHMPAQNLYLISKKSPITYNIFYELDGGTDYGNPQTYTIESDSHVLIDPAKEGHRFDGWYLNQSFEGDQITQIEQGTIDNITLFAKWTAKTYQVYYGIVTSDYDAQRQFVLRPGEIIIDQEFGEDHSLILTSMGRILAWGYNNYGQLGDGTTVSSEYPVDITHQFDFNENETIVGFALGSTHSLLLTSDGRLFSWGDNDYGQLGDGTTTGRYVPLEITEQFQLQANEQIMRVVSAHKSSLALTSDHRIFGWGSNWSGQLGFVVEVTKIEDAQQENPIDVTHNFSFLPGEVPIDMSMDSSHVGLVTSEGRLLMWGSSNGGILGFYVENISNFPPTDITHLFTLLESEKITDVELGSQYSMALTSMGNLYTWGRNYDGQLGDGTYVDRATPMDITEHFVLSQEEKIVSIYTARAHVAALTSANRIFTWGDNFSGQLGNNNSENSPIPIDVTSYMFLEASEIITKISIEDRNSSILTSHGRLIVWGTKPIGGRWDGLDFFDPYLTIDIFYQPTLIHTETITYNELLSLYQPTKDGYVFDGWYENIALSLITELTHMPPDHVFLYCRWLID